MSGRWVRMTPPHSEPRTEPRDSMTVQEIARNIVREFPGLEQAHPLLAIEIAGALGHERDRAEAAHPTAASTDALRAASLLADACRRYFIDGERKAVVNIQPLVERIEALAAIPPSDDLDPETGRPTWDTEV